jgi:tRNA (guanine37-N1)-methyltransferase
MTGGEVAAMAVIETCVRLIPGVLGNQSSTLEESFSSGLNGMLEYPQYTRPASFMDLGVPQVLLSGDHAKVAAWRRQQALQRTSLRRPELLVQQARKPESKSE